MSTLLVSLIIIWILIPAPPLKSPLSEITTFRFIRPAIEKNSHQINNKKIVMGFLPYWNLQHTTIQPEVNRLVYFSLTIDGQGKINSRQKNG